MAAKMLVLIAVTVGVVTGQECRAGRKPKLVFRQTYGEDRPKLATEWNERNPTDPENEQFSILSKLEDYRIADGTGEGELELLLLYPKWDTFNKKYNHWSQTSNPVAARTRGVAGYNAIDVNMVEQGWGGLEKHSNDNYCFLDGSVIDDYADKMYWFYCIGMGDVLWGRPPGIPASGITQQVVELYVCTGDEITTTTTGTTVTTNTLDAAVADLKNGFSDIEKLMEEQILKLEAGMKAVKAENVELRTEFKASRESNRQMASTIEALQEAVSRLSVATTTTTSTTTTTTEKAKVTESRADGVCTGSGASDTTPQITADGQTINLVACGDTAMVHTKDCTIDLCQMAKDVAELKTEH